MIFRLQLVAVILLLAVFVLLLQSIVLLNQDSDQAEILMTAPENCTGVCLLGIHPGKTTVRDAMTLIKNHPWTDDVQQNAPGNGYAQISWGWSGKQPALIDTSKRGRITFVYDIDNVLGISLNDTIIETVTIYTHVPIYSFQKWFGETNSGNIHNRLDGTIGYAVYYDSPGGIINLTTDMICPVTIISYWNATTRMTVSIGNNSEPYTTPSAMIRLC